MNSKKIFAKMRKIGLIIKLIMKKIRYFLFLVFGFSLIVNFRSLKKLERKFNENPLLNNDLQCNELSNLSYIIKIIIK